MGWREVTDGLLSGILHSVLHKYSLPLNFLTFVVLQSHDYDIYSFHNEFTSVPPGYL